MSMKVGIYVNQSNQSNPKKRDPQSSVLFANNQRRNLTILKADSHCDLSNLGNDTLEIYIEKELIY